MAQFKSPNGSIIVSAYEYVPCEVGISGIDPVTGAPEYDGSGSVMDWNKQEPFRQNGMRLYIDAHGIVWRFDHLTQIEADE